MMRPAPCGSFGWKALSACSRLCSDVQLAVDSTMPDSVFASAMLARASSLPPSATATGSHLPTSSMAFSA